ncbi:uncharacterized protein LOC125959594 [Anopheles darlingi]|uniref:uncharacterized protein LOC125959594 n=1 Tax=Anopheles darlingi TaxID=43151 RepID=UPI00210048A2|nr:uncharacterized protein LOC125959594 [Anopheles darlingi]
MEESSIEKSVSNLNPSGGVQLAISFPIHKSIDSTVRLFASNRSSTISKHILLRNIQLRRVARVLLLDGQFLQFWEAFNEVQIALLQIAEGLAGVNFSQENAIQRTVFDLEVKVAALRHTKVCCERNIATLRDLPRHLLKCTIEKRLKDAELVDMMDSEESVRTLQDRVQSEIERTLNEAKDDEQEIVALREKLFPSAVSLTTQRNVTIEQRDQQAVDLEQQLQMIDQLETQQQNIEERVERLIEARGDIQRQLADWQGIHHDGLRDIVRLERLIEVLERELAAHKEQFEQKAFEMQQKRLEILEDEALDTSERSERLQAWDVELLERNNSHTSNMDLLEARCDKLKKLSKNLMGNVDTFEQELATDFQTTMTQLEREKNLAKTASQQILLQAKAHNLQQEYEENLELVSRARTRPNYLTDENGRYYLDNTGVRIYQRNSGASAYCLSEDGHWTKIRTPVSINDQGSTISCPTSVGELMSGESSATSLLVLTPATQATESRMRHDSNAQSSDISKSNASPADSEVVLESESEIIRKRVAPDVAYVQQVVGPAVVKGMAAVAMHRPTDPVRYLADYLKHFHENLVDADTRKRLTENVRSEG